MLSRLAGPPTRYFSTTFPLMRLLPPEVGSQECSYPIAGKKTRYVDLKNAFNDVKSGKHSAYDIAYCSFLVTTALKKVKKN